MRITKITVLFFIIWTTTTSFTIEKAKILIIGDSISLGYTPFAQKSLEGLAEVYHNPGNAQHTGKGLENIEAWIGDTKWDVIQFNWGLWDLCYRHPESTVQGKRDKINGEITFSLKDYESNLDAIVKLMRKSSDAKLIFVTTTYVPEDEAGRFKKDAKKYNSIARRVMKANDVIVNDIYKVSKGIHTDYGRGSKDVHYTDEGYESLAKHITDFLKKEMQFVK